MKKLRHFITFILIFIFFGSFAQNIEKFSDALIRNIDINNNNSEYTVWIFFTDKGKNLESKIQEAKNNISERSIQRRQKLIKNGPIVDYYDIPVEESYVEQIIRYILQFRHRSRWLNAVSAEVSKEDLLNIADFEFVKKIDIVRKSKYDNKSNTGENILSEKSSKSFMYNLDYGSSITQLEQINVPTVHDLGYSGNGIIICVLDAGFNNLEHQVFSTMDIADQWDFVNNDGNVDDEGDMGSGNHGTMTLSSIGGFYEGELIGPAYGATYLLAKTENTDSETQIEEDNWVAGAEWADALGADITSTSLSYLDFDDGSGYSAAELDGNTAVITIAGDIAAGKGILVVNSAGNEGGGTTTIGAPADGDSIMAVGAVYSDGSRVYFSSVGPTGDGRIKPEVMAMGSGVYVAETVGNFYTTASGTSFSCPLTAGAAALLWEMVPTASNMEIFEALKITANNADDPNNYYGWGIIDIYAAYEYLALPHISHIPLPDSENFNGPYIVNAEVSSNYDLVNESPKLFYRRDNGTWNEIIMTVSKESNNYVAEIPGNGSPAEYDYYITAENSTAVVSLPENAPSGFFSFSAETDIIAPVIVHNSIAEYYINLWPQAQIIAEISDNTEIDLENTFVSWKLNGTEQTDLNFSEINGIIYSCYFPNLSLNINDLIEYKIIAQDNSQAQNISTFPESGYQSFYITDRISFEQNQFSHNWTFNGEQNWFVASDQFQNGSYSAKSGNIDDDEFSSISITFASDEQGDINFHKMVSSESDWDYLRFYINGSLEEEWSGDVAWSQETFNLNPGTHVLKWSYEKDGSVSNGGDCAWIDNITLPGVTATYSVIFNVSDGINPIEEASINFFSQNMETNSGGQAIFNEIPPGNDMQYTVSKDGFTDFLGSLSVIDQDVEEDVILISGSNIKTVSENRIILTPSPASEFIKLNLTNSDDPINEVLIYDISGQVQLYIPYFSNQLIDVSGIENGIYLCKIITSKHSIIQKFLIAR